MQTGNLKGQVWDPKALFQEKGYEVKWQEQAQ